MGSSSIFPSCRKSGKTVWEQKKVDGEIIYLNALTKKECIVSVLPVYCHCIVIVHPVCCQSVGRLLPDLTVKCQPIVS